MTINNPHDLASFEPEAILAAVPGDHPRMAAALALGREASYTGYLDVAEPNIAELGRLANEIYAEGFPAGSPFKQQESFPSNASLSHIASDSVLPNAPSPAVPDGDLRAALENSLATQALPNHEALHPQLAQSSSLSQFAFARDAQVSIEHLLAGAADPYQAELSQLFGSNTLSAVPHSAASNGLPSNISQPIAAASTSPDPQAYYFLAETAAPATKSVPAFSSVHPAFDVHAVRKDFPILRELVNGRPLIWFDNAATTQKPQVVIDRVSYFYQHENSNIHRAAHALAARATDAYEEARETVRRFINAPSVDNIVFVRGTTEAINLVAKTWGKKHIGAGDEIVISHLEHHANIVPWQQLCQETGAVLKVAPVDDSGQVLLDEYQKLLTSKVKLVSFTQVSNALGTVTPAAAMIAMAQRAGAKVLLDGAQSVSHMRTDVQALNPDFLVFSGHKVFGPTGIGALYGKQEVLNDMPAWQGGGNMIQDVTFDKTVYHEAPAKFEAGTGNIADAVGLGAALQYVERIGIENIARYEHALLEYATQALSQIDGLRLIGTAQDKASVLSFQLKGYQSEEVGAALNEEGIAVRSGHHCAQPILRRFGVETTVRPSLAFYNTTAEVDAMVRVLRKLASARYVA